MVMLQGTRTRRAPEAPTTASQVLDVAERLAQTRGFNGFSYGDIAAELGISKADLGRALIERYSRGFSAALAEISGSGLDAPGQLRRYTQLYADVLGQGRLCLCGMLAAEYSTLPESMKPAIRKFFDDNDVWLARVLQTGRHTGTLVFQGSPVEAARLLTAGLEGAMLLARSFDDRMRFLTGSEHLLRSFAPPPAASAPSSTLRPPTHPDAR